MSNIMNSNKSITELIKERVSVRTYESIDIDEEKIKYINEFIMTLNGPFDEKIRFKMINLDEAAKVSRIGTYGVIKGARNFIAVACKKGEMNLEEVGYEMEKLILYITSLGLGTCWVGGTFNKGEFAKAIDLKEDEILPIITPVGIKSGKKRFIDTTVKFLSNSKKRKEWCDIFFLRDFSVSLTPIINLDKFKEALENVRLAPSAVNKQPWRVVKIGDKFHFYIDREKGYSRNIDYDIHRIDMGIAMCHFDLTCREHGIYGEFIKDNPKINDVPKRTEYVVTWKPKDRL